MFNGIIALGFCWSPNTWLRCSDFHKLDALVLLVTAGEYVAAILGSNSVTLRPFRLLRVFRAIVKIKSFLGVKTIIRTLRQGITQLGVVILMLFFFMCGFGIFGMAMYQVGIRGQGNPKPATLPLNPKPSIRWGFGICVPSFRVWWQFSVEDCRTRPLFLPNNSCKTMSLNLYSSAAVVQSSMRHAASTGARMCQLRLWSHVTKLLHDGIPV